MDAVIVDAVPKETQIATVDPMRMLDRMSANGASAESMKVISDIAMAWLDREAKQKFAEAIAGFQSEMPIITERKNAGKFYYAPMEHIMPIAGPILKKWGIITSFTLTRLSETEAIGTTRVRVGSYFEDTTLPSMVITKSNMPLNEAQFAGQLKAYLERYTFCMSLRIITQGEDDERKLMNAGVTGEQITELTKLVKQVREVAFPKDDASYDKWLGQFKAWLGVKQDGFLDITKSAYANAVDDLKRRLAAKGVAL